MTWPRRCERWLCAGFRACEHRTLPRSAIPREIGAGISVAAVAIPIGLAYSKLVGVPPEIGLYASIFPTLAYALFGPSSRYLIVGPDTATGLLLGTTITGLGVVALEARAPVAAGLTLLVGMACLGASMLRLGFIANLISRPVLVGYLAGVSLTLFVTQLSSITQVEAAVAGLAPPVHRADPAAAEIHWPSLALAPACSSCCGDQALHPAHSRAGGGGVIALILSRRRWISAGAASRRSARCRRASLRRRLPVFVGDPAKWSCRWRACWSSASPSGILTARAFGQRIGANNEPNRELAGFGAADIAAGLFQGFAVTGADQPDRGGLSSGGQSALVGCRGGR